MRKEIFSIVITILIMLGVTSITAKGASPAVTELTVGGVDAFTTTSGTNWSFDGVDTLTLSGDVGNIKAEGDLKIVLTNDVTVTTDSTDSPIYVYGSVEIDATGYTLTADAVDSNKIAIRVYKFEERYTGDFTITGGKVVGCTGENQEAVDLFGNLTVNGNETIFIASNKNGTVAMSISGSIINNGTIICSDKIWFNNYSRETEIINNGCLCYLANNCAKTANLTVKNNALIVLGVTSYDVVTDTIVVSGSNAVIEVESDESLNCNVSIPGSATVQIIGDSILTIPAGITFSNQGTILKVSDVTVQGGIIGNQPEDVGYLITFDGGDTLDYWVQPSNMPPVQSVAVGNKVIEPEAPVDSNSYGVFCGWYTDEDCWNKFDFDTVITHSMTLYAKWGRYDISNAIVELSDNEITYGEELPSIEVFDGTDVRLDEIYYRIIYLKDGEVVTTPINAGTYVVMIEGMRECYGFINQDVTLTINKAEQGAPIVQSVGESAENIHDGKIIGVDNTMEYSADNGITWTRVTGTEITGLSAGSYCIRYAEKDNYKASSITTVIVEAYSGNDAENESDTNNSDAGNSNANNDNAGNSDANSGNAGNSDVNNGNVGNSNAGNSDANNNNDSSNNGTSVDNTIGVDAGDANNTMLWVGFAIVASVWLCMAVYYKNGKIS